MKCQSCGKKQATVRYIENINGVENEIYFCEDCAKNLGFSDFSDIFSPIFASIPKYIFDDITKSKCEKCGYTLDEYSKTGLFGCPECYDTFRDELDKIFLKLHDKNRHVKIQSNENIKKVSSMEDKNSEILKLKNEIKKYIENEDYENAAIARDKIKKIEGK
jgi:protein arginine kinase activator